MDLFCLSIQSLDWDRHGLSATTNTNSAVLTHWSNVLLWSRVEKGWHIVRNNRWATGSKYIPTKWHSECRYMVNLPNNLKIISLYVCRKGASFTWCPFRISVPYAHSVTKHSALIASIHFTIWKIIYNQLAISFIKTKQYIWTSTQCFNIYKYNSL